MPLVIRATTLITMMIMLMQCGSARGTITVYETAEGRNEYIQSRTISAFNTSAPSGAEVTIAVDSSIAYQTMLGFGGAFTDSAVHMLQSLNQANYDKVMDAYFGPNGQQYTFGRIPMGSCDFSLKPEWSYDEVHNDFNLTHFTVEQDVSTRIPVMQDALKRRAASNATIKMLGSPWSAPGWMKANGHMICGLSALIDGCALKRDPKYYTAFANYFVKFVENYAAHNIPIWGVTVTNEPGENLFTYEGMVFTPETERDFVKNYLGPITQAQTPDLKLLFLDHNKDKLPLWSHTILSDPDAAKYLWGAAVHWYTGDHFDALANMTKAFPSKKILATEATEVREKPKVAFLNGTWAKAEHYAHDMIGDFNNGVVGFIDWNLILDQNGGPLHIGPEVGNLFGSDSMVIADLKEQVVYFQTIFWYVGHFSRFVPEGSIRIGWDATGTNATAVETTSFLTPENNIVVVVMNTGDRPVEYAIANNSKYVGIIVPAHGIQTVVFPKET